MVFGVKHGCLLILAGVAAACRSDRPAADAAKAPAPADATPAASPASPPLVHVTATDFKLDLPAKIPAGAVTMHLMNEGKEMHQAMIARLEGGKTMADFAQAMKSNGPLPDWVKFVGGPNGIVPGATTTATTGGMKGPPPAIPLGGVGGMQSGGSAVFTADLAAGDYAFICFVPDAKDGKAHLMHGMMQQFAVK